MAITFHPKPGMILMCDFTDGFQEPELVKNRPVLVISPPIQERPKLVTVVGLSSQAPDRAMPYHMVLPKACLPNLGFFQAKETWVKGDMIYAVSFQRLDLIKLGERNSVTGKRLYYQNRLGRENMKQVYGCVLAGIGLKDLIQHLPE